jgi:hypothetical protein
MVISAFDDGRFMKSLDRQREFQARRIKFLA